MKKIFLVVISLIVLTAPQVYAQLAAPPPTLRLEVTRSVTKRDSGDLYSTTFYIRAINTGGSTIPKTTVPWFNMTLADTRGTLYGGGDGGGTHLQSDIGPGQSFEFSFPFRTLTPTGDYIYTITGWQLRDSENRTQSQNVTNIASYRFRVDEQPLPERRQPVLNLKADGVGLTPASPRPGDKVTIEGGFSNLSNDPALNVISRLELFRDGRKISNWPDKQSLRIERHSGDSIRYEMQNIEAGSYVARLTIDPDGRIVERDKSDNVSETRFLVGVSSLTAPPPTFRLEVTRSVTKRDSGGLYSTTFYIRAINTGGSTIPKTTVPWFNMTLADTRGTLYGGGDGGGTHLQSDIGPGQSFEFSFPFRTLTPTGDYIYTITGWQLQDSANRTQSQNVTNIASYRFRVDEQPLPERQQPVLNLKANGVVITPASPRPGDKVTIEGGISNLGIDPALNVISRLELFRDGRKISNWPDKKSIRIENHSGDSIRYEMQNIEAGSYVARLTIDPDGRIVERDKSDNVWETRFLVGFQPGRAAIAVTIEPVGARNAGAQWRVDGGAWQDSGSTLSNVAAGQRSIEYKDIPGWIRPSQESANITAGQTTSLTKNYTLQSGSLQVTIQPNNIAQAGAQWRVGGGPWQASGATVSNLPVGNQTIEFKDVSGWIKPAATNINITVGQTVQTGGTYRK